ncbi:nuclease [Mycobacterium phage EagleEye]|uniref:DUF4417 domain-containing protein n=1 Tax=Mycobacterium phage EagleEye TaxID=1429759 RepID=W0LIR3_9CAUD|nr:nuclease [Mycobacterium phage EagleEye]AHG23783.1 hypothetical protein PBI_EAGLEEYE_1 [Mycobacterium phage EagleEye]QDK03530.1 hypothetical protein SEA_LUCYEDI_1 [Mycobacterium phage Lucyedi]QNJ55870.1 hypothetical protein SEA_PAINTERBOY_1 [Mycobacterium phage PainterBoy]
MFGTRSSVNWDTQPGKFDVLNLRMRFDSSSEHEIPDLAATDFVPANLAAWNMPRHREYAAISGGALHFFLDDYRFETVWSAPERLFDRVKAVGAALTPDFSLWVDMPRAAQVWNVYRSRWCGAYWQSQGIEVIPTACWATPDTFDFCFDGIPDGATVAVSSMGIRSNKKDQALFRAGIQELVDRKQPRLVLAYGRLRYCDDIDLPEVREYPTFWDRRRKQVAETWEDAALAAGPVPAAEGPARSHSSRTELAAPGVPAAVAALQDLAEAAARETLVPELAV